MAWAVFLAGGAILLLGCGRADGGPDALPGPAPGAQAAPSVASNGDGYLVAWRDGRDVSDGVVEIYGARVSSAAAVMDPCGIAMLTDDDSSYWTPGLASNGADYLVVWDSRATRVSGGGAVIDVGGFGIANEGSVLFWAVAGGGENYLVAWWGGGWIHGTPIGFDGTVANVDGFPLASTSGERVINPQLAASGSEFVLVWSDSGAPNACGLCLLRLTADALALDMETVVSTAPVNGFSVASNDSNVLLAWEIGGDVFATRLSTDGVVLDSSPILVSVGAFNFGPAVASNGDDYLVVWQGQPGTGNASIYASRISKDGDVLDPAPLRLPAPASSAIELSAVASDGTDYFVAWQQESAANLDIYGARVSAEGIILDPDGFLVSSALPP